MAKAKSKHTSDSKKKKAHAQPQPRPQTRARARAHPNAPQIIPNTNSDEFLATFKRLQELTPRDANGFLHHVLDPLHIPPDFDTRPVHKQAQIIEAATLKLSMLEGYHSFDLNRQPRPIWTQLPHEPESYYQAFRRFLTSADRSLTTSSFSDGTNVDDDDPITYNEDAFSVPGFDKCTIREAYILFYWSDRARSYDILKPIAAARLRDQRVMLTEDAHFMLTGKVLGQLGLEIEARAGDQEGRPWAGMKANEIVQALTAMMQMQRVALGLPSHGPKIKDTAYIPAPHGGVERGIRESSANYVGAEGGTLTGSEKMRKDIERMIATDPEAAAELQAAAIRLISKARDSGEDETANHGPKTE